MMVVLVLFKLDGNIFIMFGDVLFIWYKFIDRMFVVYEDNGNDFIIVIVYYEDLEGYGCIVCNE